MSVPSTVRAIFFDAVGTLIHPNPPAPEVYATVGRRHGSRLTAAEIGPRFKEAFAREEELDRQAGWRTDEERELLRWRRIVGTVLDDVTDPTGCFRELFTHFSQPSGWRCEPDVAPTLAELARRGYVLGVASNYDARLRGVVAGLSGLRPLEHLVISSEVGWRKPAAEFFATMSKRVGRVAAEMLFVGDDPVNDRDGPRAAGMHALLVGPDVPLNRLCRLLPPRVT